MAPWAQKIFIISFVFVLTIEYFYKYVRHHIQANNKSEINYMVQASKLGHFRWPDTIKYYIFFFILNIVATIPRFPWKKFRIL